MEYISAEEFLKQPIEVQKILIDWWKPEIFDLVYIRNYKNSDNVIIGIENDKIEIAENISLYNKERLIPLFTEGQLRKFIIDKKCIKLDIDFTEEDGYWITCYTNEEGYITYEELGFDIFKAYWLVVCGIVEEELY